MKTTDTETLGMEPCSDFEGAPCPLSCSPRDQVILTGEDRLNGLPGHFTVVKCLSCGLMRTEPRPSPEKMGSFYPESYGPYVGTRIKTGRKTSTWKSGVTHVVKKIIRFNTQVLPELVPGHMLEIGCASGSFLHKMAEQGWDVEGIEVSSDAAHLAQASGYRVHIGTLESAPDARVPYDLVVGWMVLEHLHEPVLALQKLQRWVKPGGYLVLSVPNTASLEFKIFKDAWYALQLPTHLYHYSPKTLELVLKQSGWELEKIYHQRVLSNLVASIGYKLGDWFPNIKVSKWLVKLPNNAVWLNYLLYPFAYLFSTVGQTGRMTVWARKVR